MLHLQDMQILFLQPESEHNWEKFAKALAKYVPCLPSSLTPSSATLLASPR